MYTYREERRIEDQIRGVTEIRRVTEITGTNGLDTYLELLDTDHR